MDLAPTIHYRDNLGREVISKSKTRIFGPPTSYVTRNLVISAQNNKYFEASPTVLSYQGWNMSMSGDTGQATASVTPVYKWQGPGTPPESIYIAERAMIYTLRTHRPVPNDPQYSDENPYRGERFTITEASNGFKDQIVGWPMLPDGHTVDNGTQTDGICKIHLTKLKTGRKLEVKGSTRDFKLSASTPGFHFGNDDRGGYAMVNGYFMYDAPVAVFNLDVRLRGSTNEFKIDAAIAAGAKASIEHVADVQLTVKAPFHTIGLSPVPEEPIFIKPEIFYGEGYQGPRASWVSSPGPFITDQNGSVLLGGVRSSNKLKYSTEPGGRVRLRLMLGLGSASDPSAYLYQVWDGTWDYENFFTLDNPDPSAPIYPTITFKPAVEQALIKGHKIRFRVTRVVVVNRGGGFTHISADAEPDLVASLASFLQETATEGPPGMYKQNLKIVWNPKYIVERVYIQAIDETDWEEGMPE